MWMVFGVVCWGEIVIVRVGARFDKGSEVKNFQLNISKFTFKGWNSCLFSVEVYKKYTSCSGCMLFCSVFALLCQFWDEKNCFMNGFSSNWHCKENTL